MKKWYSATLLQLLRYPSRRLQETLHRNWHFIIIFAYLPLRTRPVTARAAPETPQRPAQRPQFSPPRRPDFNHQLPRQGISYPTVCSSSKISLWRCRLQHSRLDTTIGFLYLNLSKARSNRTTRRRRNHFAFFKIFMTTVTRLSTLLMGSSTVGVDITKDYCAHYALSTPWATLRSYLRCLPSKRWSRASVSVGLLLRGATRRQGLLAMCPDFQRVHVPKRVTDC